MIRFCDLVVSGGVFFLLLFTPFAFGAVHPWAFIVMESAIFITVSVALVKVIYLGHWSTTVGLWLPRLAIPLALFIGLVLLQLLPLPPALIAVLSPNSYALFQTSLPGWPENTPYVEPAHNRLRDEAQLYIRKLLELEPNFTVERFGQNYSFKRANDRERYMEGLRLAGIPKA